MRSRAGCDVPSAEGRLSRSSHGGRLKSSASRRDGGGESLAGLAMHRLYQRAALGAQAMEAPREARQ